MAEFGKGAPVGKSFEVYAPDEAEATHQAWRAAEAVGFDYGRTLYVEQIAAGRWEVVLAEADPEARRVVDEMRELVEGEPPRTRESLIEAIREWFAEGGNAPEAATFLLREALVNLTLPRDRAEIAQDIREAAVVHLAKSLDHGPVRLTFGDFAAMDQRESEGVGIFIDIERVPGQPDVIVLTHARPQPKGVN